VRKIPTDLADEILSESSRWSLNSARFTPLADCDPGVSILLSEEGMQSEIAVDGRPPRVRRRDAEALKRAGYEILTIRSRPFHARRLLRGLRELDAEVERLMALSTGQSELASFPSRVHRRPRLPASDWPFSIAALAAFERMRHMHRWKPHYVCVARRAQAIVLEAPRWSIGAWCLFIDEENEALVILDVQLFWKGASKTSTSTEFPKLERTLRRRLAPLGYREIALHGPNKPPPFLAIFEKRVTTLSEACRERARLDRLLFGD
jgi:hypothetical protein